MSDPQAPAPLPFTGGELGPIPFLRPHPGRALFRRRAERLRALAAGHVSGDFLQFLATLAAAQHSAAERLGFHPGERGLPPSHFSAPPPDAWREALALLVRELEPVPMPAPAREALIALGRKSAAQLDAFARRVLDSELIPDELAAAPLAGAALQVVYGELAAAHDGTELERTGEPGCPLCGFAPVAGIVLGDDKLRYLACGLCGAEWHHTRLQCALCRSAERVSHLSLEPSTAGAPGSSASAKAEVCTGCNAYVKLFYVEKAPGAEPFADDLATLSLDLLVAERGHLKYGRNLFLAVAGD